MRMPYTIPKSTITAFAPSDAIGSLPNEIGRTVKAENFDRSSDGGPAPLKSLCLDAIASNFPLYPQNLFGLITAENGVYLEETLDPGLPIPSVVQVVADGEYWRRRIDHERKITTFFPSAVNTVPKFGWYPAVGTSSGEFKTFYLTEFVSRTVENLEPGYVDEPELVELLTACAPHVTELRCGRLRVSAGPDFRDTDARGKPKGQIAREGPMHVDLGLVLGALANVRAVSLVYGPGREPVRGYASEAYSMDVGDVDTLGRGMLLSKNLGFLAITESDLDAAKFNRLSPYMARCGGLVEINFSYCKLSTEGARSVARYVKTAERLKLVNLCGNRIGPEGVKSLSSVSLWRRNNGYPPIGLILSTNDLGDIGVKHLASVMETGIRPFTELVVRDCGITKVGGMDIVRSLAYDRGLRVLKIDNNPLSVEVAIALHAVLKSNFNVVRLSTRNCDFPERMTIFFGHVAFHNRYGKRAELSYGSVDSLLEDVREAEEEETISREETALRPEIEGEEEEEEEEEKDDNEVDDPDGD